MPELIDDEKAASLFGRLPVQVLQQDTGKSRDKLQSEIWPLFVYFALFCLIAESALLLTERTALNKETEKFKAVKKLA